MVHGPLGRSERGSGVGDCPLRGLVRAAEQEGNSGGSPTSRGQSAALGGHRDVGEFVDALLVLDDYCHRQQFGWDVLGETHSYLHTMRLGGEIARRENWDNFSLRGCNILLGLEHRDRDGPGVQGLLGNMRAAGKAVGAFNPPGEPEVRSRVLNQIKNVVAAEDAAIVEAAQSAVGEIRKSPRFGPAVATRRLALACPHRLVSVNSKSVPGLGVFPRMTPKKDYLARNYCALL